MSPQVNATARTECDILHLAFGGLGGHRAVVEELSKALSESGLISAAVLVSTSSEVHRPMRMAGLELLDHVLIHRRADISSMFAVAKIISRRRPKCVVAHTYRHIPAAWLGLLMARRRPKIVLVEHQSIALRNFIDEIQSVVGAIFSSAVVLLSSEYERTYKKGRFLRLLRKPVVVIPNGIEVTKGARRKEQKPKNLLTFGMASRLVPSKQVANLIDAFALLCPPGGNSHDAWLLRIAGEGPDRDMLQSKVASLGLRSVIVFDGAIDRSEMPDWYQSIDCYVHISSGESFGMSLIEAAAHGLPIVASDDASFRQIFQPDKSIVLLPSSDPHDVAASLRIVRSSQRLSDLGSAAKQVVAQNFSNQLMAIRYLQLLSQIRALPSSLVSDAIEMLNTAEE